MGLLSWLDRRAPDILDYAGWLAAPGAEVPVCVARRQRRRLFAG